MGALFLFLKSPVGRYVAIGVVVLLLATGVVAHYHAKWKTEGENKVHEQELEQQKKDLQAKNTEAENKIADAQKQLEQAQVGQQQAMQLAQSAQTAMNAITAQLSALAAKRQADLGVVQNMTDAQRALDVQTKLGVRKSGDPAPYSFTAAEVLAIDNVVTDYPSSLANGKLLEQKLTEAQARMDALQVSIQKGELAQAALQTQRDTAIQAWNDAVAAYVQVYNEFPRQRGIGEKICHVVTFGIGCKVKHWKWVKPEDLKAKPPTVVGVH